MRLNVPERRHGHLVDAANLGDRDELAVRPVAGLDRLPVDPLGSVGVAADLHVLPKLLVSDSETFGQERLDLLEHKGVAFDGCGVVRLLIPDVSPDVGRFCWAGEAAHALPQLLDLGIETFVDDLARGPATRAHRNSQLLSSCIANSTVQLEKCT